MLIEQTISNRYEFLIPVRIASFVSTNQKYRCAGRIKRIRDTQKLLLDSSSQLFHIRVARAHDHVGMRSRECRTVLLKELNLRIYFYLFVFRKRVPPNLKLVGELNVPRHSQSMPFVEYSFKGIIAPNLQIVKYLAFKGLKQRRKESRPLPSRAITIHLDYVATF